MKTPIFFDIDGTLTRGGSSAQQLAAHLGHAMTVHDAERQYDDGLATNTYVAEVDAAGWAGRSVHEVQQFLFKLDLVDGIDEVVTWCRGNGLEPMVASLAWRPVGEMLCDRFGFAAACGPELDVVSGYYSGKVRCHFEDLDKLSWCVAQAAAAGVPIESCYAIGDGRSDIPLFARAANSVAFNATNAALAASARAVVTAESATALIPVLAEMRGQ